MHIKHLIFSDFFFPLKKKKRCDLVVEEQHIYEI